MEVIQSMNGTLWIFAAILISLVLVQSFLFLRLALNYNKKHQLVTKAEISGAVRTGAVAAVGPSINTIVVALSLIAMVGSATTFMRCGVIGAPMWELYMANIAASAAGVTLGGEGFTQSVMTFAIFCMVLGSAPYFINTIVMLKPLDKMVEKSKQSNKKISFMPYLSKSAMFGLLTYSVMDYMNKVPAIAAILCAGLGYFLWEKLSKKINSPIMSSLSLGFAMICGMVAGQVVATILA